MSLFNQTLKNSLKWQSARASIEIVRDNVLHELKQDMFHDTMVISREVDRMVDAQEITLDVGDFMKENYFWFGHVFTVDYLVHPRCMCVITVTNENKPLYDAAALQIYSKLEQFKDSYEMNNEIKGFIARCEWREKTHRRLAEMLRTWVVEAFRVCVEDKEKCPPVPNVFSTLIQFHYSHHVIYDDIVDLEGNDIEQQIEWDLDEDAESVAY